MHMGTINSLLYIIILYTRPLLYTISITYICDRHIGMYDVPKRLNLRHIISQFKIPCYRFIDLFFIIV